MKKFKQLAILLTTVLAVGCGGGSDGSNGSEITYTTTEDEIKTKLKKPIRLDSIGIIPATAKNVINQYYLIRINNYSDQAYTLNPDGLQQIDPDGKASKEKLLINRNDCDVVPAQGFCNLKLIPIASQSADTLLKVTLTNPQGEKASDATLIRISPMRKNSQGLIMFNDINRIVTEDGNYSLSIPLKLGRAYQELKTNIGNIVCNNDKLTKGNSCTYQLEGKVTSKTKVDVELEAVLPKKIASL